VQGKNVGNSYENILKILTKFIIRISITQEIYAHDVLTGLPNRALFTERLKRALILTKRRTEYIFAVLFLDVDRFKVVNDSLGHTIGDELLTALARRLENCLRAGDRVARLGGDEFTILLDDLNNV
jgi:diguanylate cyclase (GGDEF)-like protein